MLMKLVFTEGQTFVDKLSNNQVNPSETPKVITYTLLKDIDNVYLYRKPKEPYKGLLNMIGGKLHVGETSELASIREVKEKAHIDVIKPIFKGVFEILVNKNGLLFTHVVAFVYTVDIGNDTGNALVKIPIKELNKTMDLAPDMLPIFKQLTSKSITANKLIIDMA